MDSLLQSSGTIIAVIFAVAVIYSLYTTIRKKDKAEKAEKALEGRKHTHAVNLHSHDLKPHNGSYATTYRLRDTPIVIRIVLLP